MNWDILNYRIRYLLRAHAIYLSLQISETRLRKAQKLAKNADWNCSTADQTFKWPDTLHEI